MTMVPMEHGSSFEFTEGDLLLVDGAVRLAQREGPAIAVGDDLQLALLILAKAIRLNHVALALEADALHELVQELLSERSGHEDDMRSITPEALVTALLNADARLVAREELGAASVAPTGPPIVLSMVNGTAQFATIRRYAFAECEIATRLLSAASTEHLVGADGELLPNPNELLQREGSATISDEVTRFITNALTRRISVLTGGPGTGKTTAIATFLKLLAEHSELTSRTFTVALCAPTAKAAVRMREAIDHSFGPLGLERFSEQLLIAPGSGSIHRLLKIRPDASVSTIQLECDFVIVDEVSMLELTLLDQLLRCGERGHLVLVGDPDQLVSVEVGAVLRDLVEAGTNEDAPIAPLVTKLTTSHRSTHAIRSLANAINTGDFAAVMQAFHDFPTELHRSMDAQQELPQVIAHATNIQRTANEGSFERALELLQSSVVLCANREGPWSVAWWRDQVRGAVFPERGRQEAAMLVGTPVMVLRNEQSPSKPIAERLSNGDVGVVCATQEGREVFFLPGGPSARRRPVHAIDEAVPAWSFTIHKSQGSEYEQVIVSLSPSVNRILSRELLYTAITRAKTSVTVIGSDAVLRAAIRRQVQRVSSLTDRLQVRLTQS